MQNSKKFNKLVIRLRKRGYFKYAIFEIVLTSAQNRAKSSFIEKLGFFNPQFTERLFSIDTKRLTYRPMRGAVLSKTVKKYLIKFLV